VGCCIFTILCDKEAHRHECIEVVGFEQDSAVFRVQQGDHQACQGLIGARCDAYLVLKTLDSLDQSSKRAQRDCNLLCTSQK
jgi:hypothetical protein